MKVTWRESVLNLIMDAVRQVAAARSVQIPDDFAAKLDTPPRFEMGHYASPVALELSKLFSSAPRALAEELSSAMMAEMPGWLEKIEIAGPGFLNFFLSSNAGEILLQPDFSAGTWPASLRKDSGIRILFEFVSANPTGPLNIVSARAAAVGDSICRVLELAGENVEREYYVNDYGNQVRLLGQSFAVRWLQSRGYSVDLPEEGYRGDYITELLGVLLANNPDLEEQLESSLTDAIRSSLPEIPAPAVAADDARVAGWLDSAGESLAPAAVATITSGQRQDLEQFRVHFSRFFSETTLHTSGAVDAAESALREAGAVYESEGAVYFRSVDYGDDKDRVIRRSDSRPTYLLADIAYHLGKIKRGYSRILNIWGPDHHGYIPRLAGSMQALGFGREPGQEFRVLIVQQVNMMEDGRAVVMSKRLGQFQTMRDLTHNIPVDVARWFFVSRSQSSHLDFDLNLATDTSPQNPVYYVMYAHARIHSILRETSSFGGGVVKPELLTGFYRDELMIFLLRFPEEVNEIATNLEVHRMATYLYDLSLRFTHFYHQDENRIVRAVTEDPDLARTLISLIRAAASVIACGLNTLGIEAPESM